MHDVRRDIEKEEKPTEYPTTKSKLSSGSPTVKKNTTEPKQRYHSSNKCTYDTSLDELQVDY